MLSPHTKTTTTNSETSMNQYHNLSDKWSLWAHLPHDTDWSINSYKKIHTVSFVEELIALVETLPDILVKNCMLFFMRDGIKPIWEEPKNRNGGCFSYKVSEKNAPFIWKHLCYLVSGNTISTNANFVNKLNGITISPKKKFCVIKVWMCDCENQNPELITNELPEILPNGCLFKKHAPEY
jgi:hypothetical protein